MKAISILGTSSNSGKSWLATALCAWLRRQGVRVAPFKAQNMSNNSFATLDGGEIGRAQAVQAEACGLTPTVEMNPILLKPSGGGGSQLVVLGRAQGHIQASDYYRKIETLWPVVEGCLDGWKDQCDVLVLEGAGSPVELNLMDRDLVNLRPVAHLGGRWLLVADIERGGVFAQLVGTWNLLPEAARTQGLGLVVNKFRGDLGLFSGAGDLLRERIPVPYLGVLPFRGDLQPESEDSLCQASEETGSNAPAEIAWIRFPHLSNSQDAQPWRDDAGVSLRWTTRPEDLAAARLIILPGTKNTVADLRWLRDTGLAEAVVAAAARGCVIVGLCGGFQMLGETLSDPAGIAGDRGEIAGLGLLPVRTRFDAAKEVGQVTARWGDETWTAYEIHMGRTERQPGAASAPLLQVEAENSSLRDEGHRVGNVHGTYLHGLFELPAVRAYFAARSGLAAHRPATTPWRTRQQALYDGMADLLETHLDLKEVWNHVAS